MTSVRGLLCAFQGARTLLQFLLGRGVHVMTGVIYASMCQGEGAKADDKPVTMQEGDADEEAEVDYCWFCEF